MKKAFSICVFVGVLAILTTAGCASAPLYRAHTELPMRNSDIRTVGLIPPDIKMFEEPVWSKLAPHDDWSREAAESVRQAFIDETAAAHLPLTLIGAEDQELNDMADLYTAVDFSIKIFFYPLPEKARSFDYSLGPAREAMERHGVDAVWIVTGYDLLPTQGKQSMDAVDIFLGILTTPAGGRRGGIPKRRPEFRAALVDKSGTILFYCKLRNWDIHAPQAMQNPGHPDQFSIMKGEQKPDQAAQEASGNKDIRNPKIARSYVRALFAEYRKAVAAK